MRIAFRRFARCCGGMCTGNRLRAQWRALMASPSTCIQFEPGSCGFQGRGMRRGIAGCGCCRWPTGNRRRTSHQFEFTVYYTAPTVTRPPCRSCRRLRSVIFALKDRSKFASFGSSYRCLCMAHPCRLPVNSAIFRRQPGAQMSGSILISTFHSAPASKKACPAARSWSGWA